MRSWFKSALALAASANAIVALQNMRPALGDPPNVVSQVIVEGNRRMSVASIRQLVPIQDGDAFDPGALARTYQQLMATHQFSDIRFEWRDTALVVRVQEVGYVFRIRVEGNQRVEARTILSYMFLKPGDAIEADRIALSERALSDTGLFADVQIKLESGDLVVRVLENAIINRVIFEGNYAVDSGILQEETEAEPRQTFTVSRIEKDVQRILDVYRRAGHFAATVTPQYKVLPENRVDLVFQIDEGPTTNVGSMNFVGNTAFSDSRLREEIRMRQSRWWRFFERSEDYGPEQLEFDRAQLTSFYADEGYADFRITSSTAELTPDRKDLLLTFKLDEGPRSGPGKSTVEAPRVHVERIDIHGDTRELDSVIRREIRTAEGDTYDPVKVAEAASRIRALGFFNDALNIAEFISQGDASPGAPFEVPPIALGPSQSPLESVPQSRNFRGRGQFLKSRIKTSLATGTTPVEAQPELIAPADVTIFRHTQNHDDRAGIVDLSKRRNAGDAKSAAAVPDALDLERDVIAAMVAAGRQAMASNPLLDMYRSDDIKHNRGAG